MYLLSNPVFTLLMSMLAVKITDCGSAGKIAFTALLKHDLSLENNKIIDFPETLTNLGDGYQGGGIFVAPEEGVYVFHTHALTNKMKTVYIHICHNDVPIVTAYAKYDDGYAMGGNTAVLKLDVGDRVYIRTASKINLYGREDETYATFSGYRI